MNIQEIRKRLVGGFKPSVILTSSGTEFPVPHPEFVFVAPRSVIVVDDEGYTSDIDPLHIVALRPLKSKAGKR